MAVRLLESKLEILHDLSRSKEGCREWSEGVVTDIAELCPNQISTKELDSACSLLFDENSGIVAFLKQTARDDRFQNVRSQLLDILSKVVEKIGRKIISYAVDIKDVSVYLFSQDKYARVKNAAIILLIKLLKSVAGSNLIEELKIENLVEKVFSELTKPSKLAATVKSHIYILLGTVAEVYPVKMTYYAERLLGVYIKALKEEMTSKIRKPEFPVISGCLEGLTSYLVNFPQPGDEDFSQFYEIFRYARKAVNPDANLTNYDVPRAALRLFAKHMPRFSSYLMDVYEELYNILHRWSVHHNREMLNLGCNAMEAFIEEMSRLLSSCNEVNQREVLAFKFFIQKFHTVMTDSRASTRDVTMAVKGYGHLAAPCRKFLSGADVQKMFTEITNRSEQQFLGQADDLEDRLYSLPSYLEALANILREVDEVSEIALMLLERLVITLIENLPNVHEKHYFWSSLSILKVFLSLLTKEATFRQLLFSTVYQGLIRTFSHPVALETEQVIETPDPVSFSIHQISYKDYLKLWSNLLDSVKIKELTVLGYSVEERHKLTEMLYDELIAAIFKIINKLNLGSTNVAFSKDNAVPSTSSAAAAVDDADEASADPTHGAQPNKPEDHQVFVNLVSFFKDFITVHHCEQFDRWIFTFSHRIIVLSSRTPLVSGFYKLLAASMHIAKKLNYFQDVSCDDAGMREESMDVGGLSRSVVIQKKNCYLVIKKFTKEVLVRMKQYKDDLLASCLALILALPKEVINKQVKELVPAIQFAFKLGLSYLPLADIALDALEYWSESLPSQVLEPLYPDVLPYLDSYLKTIDKGAEEVSLDTTAVLAAAASRHGFKFSSVKVRKSKKNKMNKEYESKLTKVKQKILRYLGSLGGSFNKGLLAKSGDEITVNAVAWDTQQYLKFDIPFADMKPTIYLDPFLPRVVELAKKSSDRQTKVAACELLHSLVVFSLGRGALPPSSITRSKLSMEKLYRKLFPSLLELACDVDQVSKQLFEPLVLQLIHWFTNNKISESGDTMALLDAIFDGITQPTDTALRDFSAKCLREFLTWSIRQTSEVILKETPRNVKSVLKRMYSFALHPSAFKRLGAALAFNSIYRIFREEESLVDRFTFETLVHFVESLAIAHADDRSLGTQEQCCQALSHLDRIFKMKTDLLKKPSKIRTEPREWSRITLDIAVRWLVRQCGRPQTECRHACMKLVYELAPLIQGIKTTKQYFQTFMKKEGPVYFITRFEGGGYVDSGKSLLSQPTLLNADDQFTLQGVLGWFETLLAALDCYTWVFQEKLLSPAEILSASRQTLSKVFMAAGFVLEKVALLDVEGVAHLFGHQPASLFFTPREKEDYNRIKCTVIIRIFNMFTSLLEAHECEAIDIMPEALWSSHLWTLVIACVLDPTSVGFNFGDVTVISKLPSEMTKVLQVFMRKLAPAVQNEMKGSFRFEVQQKWDLSSHLPIQLTDAATLDICHLQHLLSGYTQLLDVGLLSDVMPGHTSMAALAEKLFKNVFQGVVAESNGMLKSVVLSPEAMGMAENLLDLSFHLLLPVTAVVDAVLDKGVLGDKKKRAEQYRGDLFFSLFKTVIISHIVKKADDFILLLAQQASLDSRRVSSIFVAIIDHLSQDKSLRKSKGIAICTLILANWSLFRSWWEPGTTMEKQAMALNLLTKLLLLDSKVVTDTSSATCSHIHTMYQSMLTNNMTSLAFKARVLDLLPFFCSAPEPYLAQLERSLDRFVADSFPLNSREFEGSPVCNDYIAALDKILAALVLSGSLLLLELLITVFCRENRHIHEDHFQKSVAVFIRRLPAAKQKDALDVPYKFLQNKGNCPVEVRHSAIGRACLPMLRLVKKSVLLQFFVDHICEIVKIVEAKIVKSSEGSIQQQLTSKMCAFELLEVLYSRLTKDEVNSRASTVNDRYCQGRAESGKEMTVTITKAAHIAKSEDMRGETSLLEPHRQYHCAAYNLLIAIISCTQTDQKFFSSFLFSENEAKGQFLLSNIVDLSRVYEFPVEFQSPPERKKNFVSIHSEVKKRRTSAGDKDTSTNTASLNLASQYLDASSLSEDLHRYDFLATAAVAHGLSVSLEREKVRLPRMSLGNQGSEEALETRSSVGEEGEDYVELEMDELNKHECMAPLTALLKHLQHSRITPEVPQGSRPEQMPSWMLHLHRKMNNPSTQINVKCFIAKLIVNTAEVFEPYAHFWFNPLCQLMVSGHLGDNGINCFVMDIMVTMLSWHKVAIPQDSEEERAMASRVAQFVMANIYHESRPVFKNNLEMLKILLECWKERIQLDYQTIYEGLKSTGSGSNSKPENVGVQIMGVVMACKMAPYVPMEVVDQESFFLMLAQGMEHRLKSVYAATAEVFGLVFKHLEEKDGQTDGSVHQFIGKLLSTMHQTKLDKFLVCIHRMHRHYPPIADRFLSKLLFVLPKLRGDFRTLCLEIICSRVNSIDSVFTEMKSKGLLTFLERRDEATQLVSLRIVNSMLPQLKPSELSQILPAVVSCDQHPSTKCRNSMYDILMWIYDNYRDEHEAESIMLQTKELLLKGLGDEDLHCRLLVQNFWSSETHLPTATPDRLVAMLEAMYSPVTEQQYLNYATNLILEMTSKSPDYQREIFEHPLSECKFQDYAVRSSWRERHAVMTPLFLSTQTSQDEDGLKLGESLHGQIKATVEPQEFSATQNAGSKAPFNWLTQSSLDTYASYDSMVMGAQSSLLFTVDSAESGSVQKKRGAAKLGPGFGKRRRQGTSRKSVDETDSGSGADIRHLKRRFIKDQGFKNTYFAKRQSWLNQIEETTLREQKSKRENQVTMYRRYRIGDLPDIQIKYSYIIAPLQAVAQHDDTIAKLLFSSLFKAVFADMAREKTKTDMNRTIKEINRSLEIMLSSSTYYYSPFIGCILDILYCLRKHLQAEPALLGIASLASKLQLQGITVLEEQLITKADDDPVVCRAKYARLERMSVSMDTNTWIELARLYKSINEYDVLLGIFSGKIGTQGITKKAVEAESHGNFAQAKRLYEEALNCSSWPNGQDPLAEEVDLWEDCRMQCLDKLTQWSILEEVSVNSVRTDGSGDISEVWESVYLQEHYLAHLIRSKLKLMLQGDQSQQSLLTFIDDALKIPEQKAVMENQFCVELALMYLWQENYDRARHYSKISLQHFLQEWSSINPLMSSSRSCLLQQLQVLIELQEFLNLISDANNCSTPLAAHLVERWQRRSPCVNIDPINVWDDVMTNRLVYMDRMSSHLMQQKSPEFKDAADRDIIQVAKLRMKLEMARSCFEQNNFTLMLRILKETRSESARDKFLVVEWSQLYAAGHQKKAALTNKWTKEETYNVLTTLDQLGKHLDSPALLESPSTGSYHYILCGKAFELLATGLVRGDIQVSSLDLNVRTKLMTYVGTEDADQFEVTEALMKAGFKHLKGALKLDEGAEGLGQAYLVTANYCNKFLRFKEDDPSPLIGDTSCFPDTVTVCLLKAIRLDVLEAQQRYPRLLQLVEQYPETTETFIRQAGEVPCWMFVAWISQMMALMDKKVAPSVQGILLSIAQDYPQAIVYPFLVSMEGFKFGTSARDRSNEKAVEGLGSLLKTRVPLVSKFISALEQFSQPDMLFRDWSGEIKLLLREEKRDKGKICESFRKMFSKLFVEQIPASSSQPSPDTQPSFVEAGSYRQKFASNYWKHFQEAFGKDGHKLASMSFEDFTKCYTDLNGKFKSDKSLTPPNTLKEYCSWLANFNLHRDGQHLEVPGQYGRFSKPLPEYHVKIAGFDPRVLVLSSMRKPKRITIRGNDEREYQYLVKGGEDLRQDQRIEQLFLLMNQVLNKDHACASRHLHLTTYQVVPMTPRIGLIEWLNNTQPLKNFLGFKNPDSGVSFNFDEMHNLQKKWLSECTGRNLAATYANMYLKYNRMEVEKHFRIMENKVPWDLSRRAFQQMSTSPEAFHVLRCRCAVSHAVICMCQYILGIGDRHLSNFMVHLETGQMIGIDFGHSFGSATQFLPVPELMPFRLTRQLKNLLLPLEVKGLLESTMAHVLRTLRSDHNLLLSTMDVFVKEPSLDWLKFAEQQFRDSGEVVDQQDATWFPKQKIRFAQRKLAGDNPSYITRDELELGFSKMEVFKAFERVALGDKKDSTRAQLPGISLTVDEQVAALIDQATDPDILCRVYQGWEPWV